MSKNQYTFSNKILFYGEPINGNVDDKTNGTYRVLPDNVCPKAKRLVTLSGFSIDIYTIPSIPSWRFG